ncbi:DUF5665 domain-containing protein [Alkaliphilus sp. B6464]|uniref:DUF5665 domain-containing protein n=1 Tax=Alkaliphilus sp. B6464 TaxID=2731219 RepID=UPI002011E66F|nr:DUF5665 domain-containing protein [Alkaliphilus sp. B6464]
MSQNKQNHASEIANEITNMGQIERLSRKMDNMRVAEYVEMISNPRRIIFMNFVAGLARGLGMGIGFTVLAGIVIYLLRSWVNLPYIGKIVADLLNIIDGYR